MIGGVSAGGALAASLCLSLDAGEHIAGPHVVTPTFERPDEADETEAGGLTSALVRETWDAYVPPTSRDDPGAVPAAARVLHGLPPVFIGVAEHDFVRDEAVRFAARLVAPGVDTTLRAFSGATHGLAHPVAARRESIAQAVWGDAVFASLLDTI